MSQFNNALEAVVNNALNYENIRIYKESTVCRTELVEWDWTSDSLRALKYYNVVSIFPSENSPSLLYIIVSS